MLYFLAIFLPFLALFQIGEITAGIICLILQLTIIGWIPAAIWGIIAVNNYNENRRSEKLMRAMHIVDPREAEEKEELFRKRIAAVIIFIVMLVFLNIDRWTGVSP